MASLTDAGTDLKGEPLASGKAKSDNEPFNTEFRSSGTWLKVILVTE